MRWTVCFAILLVLAIYTPNLASASDGLLDRIVSLENRVSALESLLPEKQADFTGQGSGNTMPFTITKSPWMLEWTTISNMPARPPFAIHVYTANTSTYMGGCGGVISENTTHGQSAMYTGPGCFYLHVDSDYWVHWLVNIEE